ncbi:MAG TPA: extracellular solute-binding protein, partial [Anaerolineae bacterium]|nr:extracellular solute-binding protein [Anaerolineae bacterium]
MISLISLLVLLAAGLVACDFALGTPEAVLSPPEPTLTPEPEPTESVEPGVTSLVFWEPFPLDRPQGLLLGEMIRDFEAENPDIAIEIVPKSGYVGLHGAMLARLQDGELPDLAVAFPSMIAEYAAAGVVIPLDPFIHDPELGLTETDMVDIFPGYLDGGRFPAHGQQTMA